MVLVFNIGTFEMVIFEKYYYFILGSAELETHKGDSCLHI